MKARLPVREAILKRRTYEAPAEGRADKVRLDFNENTSGCSTAAIRALRRLTPKQLAMYPEYEAPTRSIARYCGVRADELLLTNGGDDALRVFFDAFVDAGSTVLFCEPTFPMYRYYAEIYGAQIATLQYEKDMGFPLEGVSRVLRTRRPRVFFLANPNNPTGTLVSLQDIRRILEAATDTAVVLDEAYAEFSGVTALGWIRRYPRLFIARTFSKAAGLAALRLGAVMAQKESLAMLKRAMPPFPVNVAALVTAEAALRNGRAIRAYVKETLRLREWFAMELRKLGIATFPSAGNFILANFGPSGPPLFASLERKGILVRDRSRDMGPGFVRITIGKRSEMQSLLKEIARNWKKC